MTLDRTAADYCPTCGQPHERMEATERFGLSLRGYILTYGGQSRRLRPNVAKLVRVLMQRRMVGHEMLILCVCPNTRNNNNIKVYVNALRRDLDEMTNGQVKVKSHWGWGYELVDCGQQRAAA